MIGVMLAPTVGAILACVFGPGLIRFGMPSWWLLAAFLPAALVFLITLVAAPISEAVTFHPDQVGALLLMAVPQSLLGCIFALGEEIGWRGFLWPLMRRRLTFLASTAIMLVVWWIYHAGLTLAGWYGFVGGIPAFTVALLGFVLFVGVLTERSRSIWPSVLAHGSWNALVATYFSSSGAGGGPGFTGSRYLLGEFGWLGAAGMLILGVGFVWWHFRTPTKDGLSPKEPTGYESPLMTDPTMVQAAANTRLRTLRGTSGRTVSIDAVPHPAIKLGDAVAVTSARLGLSGALGRVQGYGLGHQPANAQAPLTVRLKD